MLNLIFKFTAIIVAISVLTEMEKMRKALETMASSPVMTHRCDAQPREDKP